MGIGIGDMWFGFANELISFINNRVMALDSCKNCIFAQYLLNKWREFDKNFVYTLIYIIDVYKIQVWTITYCFSSIFNRVMTR